MRSSLFEAAPLMPLAFWLMAGIVVGYYMPIVPLWPLFAGTVVAALLLWRYENAQSVMIVLCVFVLGVMAIGEQRRTLATEWPDGEVVFEAVVLTEPVEKPKTMAVDILLAGNGRKLKCYLSKDERSRQLRVGDGLQLQSHIRQNSNWRRGTFDYRRYLEIHGFTGSTFVRSWKWRKAQVSLKGLSRLDRTKLYFLRLRSQLRERLAGASVSSPSEGEAVAVVAAMALGDKSGLTRELKDVYSVTGASHVLALSGLHLGIIYTLISFLVVGRRWQAVTQWLIVLGIWGFVFLVGLSTSVVRSAVMLSVYALLSAGHRDKLSLNTLAFTAIVMLLANPLSLFDVGLQLSFVSVFSILLFLPLFMGAFSQEFLMSHRAVRWAWGMAAVSCSAQIGVAPLIAYYFGRFSTLFLLTNFIVVPAAFVILYLSIGVVAMPSLAYLLLYMAGLLNAVLGWIADVPYASIEGLHPSILQVSMTYVIILSVYLLLTLRSRRAARGYI